MPKKTENSSVEIESGFGTGLRIKLEGRRDAAEPTTGAPEDAAPEADREPRAEAVEEGPEEELSETEQLWAELEDSLAREEQLKRTLEEQAQAYAHARNAGRRIAKQAEALEKRERELEQQIRAFEEARAQPDPAEPDHGRAYLRRRVEENVEPLWRVFKEALTATKPNGQVDFRTRLMAATALLAESYGDLSHLSPGEVAAARDELAGMRAKRAAKPKSR